MSRLHSVEKVNNVPVILLNRGNQETYHLTSPIAEECRYIQHLSLVVQTDIVLGSSPSPEVLPSNCCLTFMFYLCIKNKYNS